MEKQTIETHNYWIWVASRILHQNDYRDCYEFLWKGSCCAL